MSDKWDELRRQHVPIGRPRKICGRCSQDWPCRVSELLDENEKLRAALKEIAQTAASERYGSRWIVNAAEQALGDAS